MDFMEHIIVDFVHANYYEKINQDMSMKKSTKICFFLTLGKYIDQTWTQSTKGVLV